jgi:hypothetical protein
MQSKHIVLAAAAIVVALVVHELLTKPIVVIHRFDPNQLNAMLTSPKVVVHHTSQSLAETIAAFLPDAPQAPAPIAGFNA